MFLFLIYLNFDNDKLKFSYSSIFIIEFSTKSGEFFEISKKLIKSLFNKISFLFIQCCKKFWRPYFLLSNVWREVILYSDFLGIDGSFGYNLNNFLYKSSKSLIDFSISHFLFYKVFVIWIK